MKETIAMDVFDAYAQNKLPENKGLIISAFFKEDSAYSVYEIVSYSDIKDVYVTSNALQFKANGKKITLTVEPPTKKHSNSTEKNIITTSSKAQIIFSKEPEQTTDGFDILKPEGINFSFLFYANNKDSITHLENFLIKSLNQEAIIPLIDSKEIAKKFLDIIK